LAQAKVFPLIPDPSGKANRGDGAAIQKNRHAFLGGLRAYAATHWIDFSMMSGILQQIPDLAAIAVAENTRVGTPLRFALGDPAPQIADERSGHTRLP
jgi:hypothetical protein